MATRTKSFFEQDHRSKRPGQWHRHNYNRPPLAESHPNVPPKLPIPANTQAKTKLKGFQFVEGQPDDGRKDENPIEDAGQVPVADVTEQAEDKTVEEQQASASSASRLSSHNSRRVADTPSLPHANTFPCTPGAKLSLEDLIGDCDEIGIAEHTEETPDEQIGWIPNSSSNHITPNQSRKRKRARSSSPSCPTTSSQHNDAFFGENLSQLDKTTPAADPVADLWQRYANGKESIEKLKLPELPGLMHGSPRPPLETPVKSGLFRRWASTGNDWPSSKSKRRRTGNKMNASVWQDQNACETGGKSRVAAMVQQLQETLATQRLEQSQMKPTPAKADAPSSSSPLPETGAASFDSAMTQSPLQARQTSFPHPQAPAPLPPQLSGPPSPRHGDIQATGQPPKTKTNYRQHLAPVSKAPLPAFKRPTITRLPSQPIVPAAPAPVSVKATAVNKEFDEFGDDAFDLTAEDLDELMAEAPFKNKSLYDIPPHPNPPPQPRFEKHSPPLQATTNNHVETITIDDDEFGDDDIDEASFVEAELSATQRQRISPRERSPRKRQSPRKSQITQQFAPSLTPDEPHRLQRYCVKQIIDGEYTNAKGHRCPERLLLAEDERTCKTTAITLRGSWASTTIPRGSIVHVAHLQRSSSLLALPPGQIEINDEEVSPLLIIHPDHMLSATTVADSFDCIRKAVLQDRIKATGETSKAMVYGKVLHEIFQQALSANQWDDGFLAELVERTVQAHVEGLWELGMQDTNLAVEEVKAKMGELGAWAKVFVGPEPGSKSLVDGQQGEKVLMSISRLVAIEEHIWSPRYGLKGNVDATVQATLKPDAKVKVSTRKLITPFEVKTGRTTQSPAHRAQTALYTLLLSDRYDVAVEAGILYYLESSSMTRIAPAMNEIRQMVQQRNRLAGFIHTARHPAMDNEPASPPSSQAIEESGLPALLKNPHKCGRCYAQQACFTYHALVEDGGAESAGMVDDGKKNHSLVWDTAVGHLLLESGAERSKTAEMRKWFTKWDRLLTFEESEQSRLRKELWTMSSEEREGVGRCFGDLILTKDLTNLESASSLPGTIIDGIEGGGKINRFAYIFGRPRSSTSGDGFNAEGGQLIPGEPVVVSSQDGKWALANGYIVALSNTEVTVAVDRKLGGARERLSAFEDTNNQILRGTGDLGVSGDRSEDQGRGEAMRYRLDKDEFSNGLALIRNNLVQLMDTDPIHTKLREQIVFDTPPTFSTPSQTHVLQPSQLSDMNEDQQHAVDKVLSANDYALILGMPGTGKTTTIAHVIRALLAEGQSILLTSYTHTAVDNILLKIRGIVPKDNVLRLGVPTKINAGVKEFCRLASTPKTSIDEVHQAYMETQIVATTCMGTSHSLFARRTFDVCIVDEASQITLPTILGPLLRARKFVLVGDHFQLPPLVQNRRALEGGLDTSLFRHLSEARPESVAELGRQYRMCEEIMGLSNALIYDGRLTCGNEAVKSRTLGLNKDDPALEKFHNLSARCAEQPECWVRQAIEPQRKVLFANTDGLGNDALETLTNGNKITNLAEATLATHLVLALLARGVPPADIGIITLYRSQLTLIKTLFKAAGVPLAVEIDSADRFQGRDKECIILSMVRNNEVGLVGELLKDWRRVNVALTRARSKLVVLGSRRTLVRNELLAQFVSMVEDNAWTIDLPMGAMEMHDFGFAVQGAGSNISPAKSSLRSSPSKSPRKSKRISPGKRPLAVQSGRENGSQAGVKFRPRIIHGRGSQAKLKKAKEQLLFEIFEDL